MFFAKLRAMRTNKRIVDTFTTHDENKDGVQPKDEREVYVDKHKTRVPSVQSQKKRTRSVVLFSRDVIGCFSIAVWRSRNEGEEVRVFQRFELWMDDESRSKHPFLLSHLLQPSRFAYSTRIPVRPRRICVWGSMRLETSLT